jgi:hypothetical protein
MDVIPPPQEGTAAILILSKKGKFSIINGQGDDNYQCGACENIICKNVVRGQIINLVFVCPNCGSYNHIKGT